MRDNIIITILVTLMLALFSYFIYVTQDSYELVIQEEKHIIIEKQIIRESTNNFGAFREEYKILPENGEIKDLELDQYMSYNIGDSITITSTYKQRK
jgi:hypothetical protein